MRLIGWIAAVASAGVAVAIVTCRNSTSLSAPVAGTYVLTVVDGEAVPQLRPLSVMSGSIVLDASGTATRHVVYLFRQTGIQQELNAQGTYAREGNGIRFAMHEETAPANAVWRPFANLATDQLMLHYPGTDAGDIIEVYERQR